MNFLRVLICVIAVVCVAGCNDQGEARLRVGTNIWPGYELFYVARERGLYEGGNIDLIEFRSALQVVSALRANSINVAALTLDEALRVRDSGTDIEIVAILDISDGAHALLAAPPITTVADIKGKRVGVYNSTVSMFLLMRALASSGLTLNDVSLVITSPDEQINAYRKGSVDVVSTFDPLRTQLLQQGAVQIFDSRAIAGEIIDVLVVRRDAKALLEPDLRNLMRGFYTIRQEFFRQPLVYSALMEGRLGIASADILQSFKLLKIPDSHESSRLLSERGWVQSAIERVRILLMDNGAIHDCECGDLIDASVIQDSDA